MFLLLVVLVVLAVSMAQEAPWFCHGIDCPNFTNSSVDSLEVRNYDSNLWTSTVVEGVDFDEATSTGFQRLFDYISGANDAGKAVDMTAPVLNHVLPGSGPNCNTTFKISFFVPFQFQPPNSPPPKPTNPDVFTETIPAMKVAVRSFGGQSKADAIITEAALLEEEVQKDGPELEKDPKEGESWWYAGYDPPFRLTNRHNEVWETLI
jgi:hypothetical protein